MRVRGSLPQRLDPRDERGVAMVLVALSLFVVFGMTVLVVDLGALIVKHRGLVNANDSASLAAAESFATNEAEVVTSEGPAQDQADAFAADNVSDAVRQEFKASIGISPIECAPSPDPDACGKILVKYQAGQSLFFAPVLGLGDQVTAHGSATAIWGPAGGGRPSPITIHFDWLEQCGVPNDDPGPDCAFWLDGRTGDDDDDEGGGNSEWAWINLNRWNVNSGSSCPNDEPDVGDWIAGRNVPLVRVNRAPTPTFVCTVSGRASRYLAALQQQKGTFKVFPVNDAAGDFAPPGQVGDKYDIVGFTVLRIADVLRGDDPAAIGVPGGTFPCTWRGVNLDPATPLRLEDQPCELSGLHYPGDPSKPYPMVRKGDKVFEGNVLGQCGGLDYCYDVDKHEITWLGGPENDVRIDWEYVVPPSPGKCGIREADRGAVCLVASWQGYRTGGINPGGGEDFGLRAIRLFE